jgi:8-oxo-dGTP diphosphatase
MRQFIATKAFIVHDGKILILRESSAYTDGTNTGRYDVPGGRLKPGEHFMDSLRREIAEETGLSVTIKAPFFVNEWRPRVKGEQWQIVGIFFLCESETNNVTLGDDHDDYQWIHPEEYEQYPLIENLKDAFTACRKQFF